MNNKKYEESLSKMEEPFDTTKLPGFKINFPAMSKYAKSVGKSVSELTEEEIDKFVEGGHQKLAEYIKEMKEEHHMCESMEQLAKESEELGKKNAIMVMIERFKKENPNATNKDVVAFVIRYSDLTKEEVESYL